MTSPFQQTFLRSCPAWEATRQLDELRAREYARIDREKHVYLDYTGGGLYAESQIEQHANLLKREVLGNPHSSSPTSAAATAQVENARRAVLEFFNADPDEYVAIFTANATGAFKIVAEAFPFDQRSRLLLTFDNHNSIVGVREFARAAGANMSYVPLTLPDMRIDNARMEAALDIVPPGTHSLLAYPAQSNFSGVQHALEWVARARRNGWKVLLDAAAFVPTNALDLSRIKPDFVGVSFYKIFGYPTGMGCLLARRETLGLLHKPWFAGGTITVSSIQGDRHYLQSGSEAFEDGTVNYLSAAAVEIGLRHVAAIGYPLIHERVALLTGLLLQQLTALRHANGAPAVRIYGPIDSEARGGTISFNVFDPNGHFVDHRRIEAQANDWRISLRTGCFCNPGSGELALGITQDQLASCFSRAEEVLTLDDFRQCITDQSTGAVRVSTGFITNLADIERFIDFMHSLLDRDASQI